MSESVSEQPATRRLAAGAFRSCARRGDGSAESNPAGGTGSDAVLYLPACKKSLESPVSFAGQKLNCPDCNQRIQVPQSPKLPPPVNKTILAEAETSLVPVRLPVRSQPQPAPPIPTLTVQLVEETSSPPAVPARRENCLECGKDVTNRTRIQSCPDCGSNFCSALCYRDIGTTPTLRARKVAPATSNPPIAAVRRTLPQHGDFTSRLDHLRVAADFLLPALLDWSADDRNGLRVPTVADLG